MSVVITCPEVADVALSGIPSIFLAGGITNCPDWQSYAIATLNDLRVVLFNPRRPDFPIDDPNAGIEQIDWEVHKLRIAHAIMFWFPAESICPIALFELGRWSSIHYKPIFVGTHPSYPRRFDVIHQLHHIRPGLRIHSNLQSVVAAAREWAAQI